MLVSTILSHLPASLDWMVLFNLTTLQTLAADATIKSMYFLPADVQLHPYSHVILSSHGRFLALHDGAAIGTPEGHTLPTIPDTERSLAQRFGSQLALMDVDAADCIGVGELPSYPPVAMQVMVRDGYGAAQAVFAQAPPQEDYPLLRAVGIEFLEGTSQGTYYLARFKNRLPVHLHAGTLAHFTRTGHCNAFFLQHGVIDSHLAAGLLQAADSRIAWGRERGAQAAARLAREACDTEMAMRCQPPPPLQPFPFGDLVPLGLLLKALHVAPPPVTAAEAQSARDVHFLKAMGLRPSTVPEQTASAGLERHLQQKRQGKLWAFHTGRLCTATDSALVLQGVSDPEAVAALDIFADGQGGYYPQLWSTEPQPDHMVLKPELQHWCQADYATTCLIRGLQREAGRAPSTPIDYLAAGFARRSGLYFANPYLVDWALASALRREASATTLQEALRCEVLASMNADYSFGQYDRALSTAFAILTLAALECRGRVMKLAQLRLLDDMEDQGVWPVSTPFYSTQLSVQPPPPPTGLARLLGHSDPHVAVVQGQSYEIWWYHDGHQMIGTAAAVLALTEPCSAVNQEVDALPASCKEPHPRYQARTQTDYVARFALPPYVSVMRPWR